MLSFWRLWGTLGGSSRNLATPDFRGARESRFFPSLKNPHPVIGRFIYIIFFGMRFSRINGILRVFSGIRVFLQTSAGADSPWVPVGPVSFFCRVYDVFFVQFGRFPHGYRMLSDVCFCGHQYQHFGLPISSRPSFWFLTRFF